MSYTLWGGAVTRAAAGRNNWRRRVQFTVQTVPRTEDGSKGQAGQTLSLSLVNYDVFEVQSNISTVVAPDFAKSADPDARLVLPVVKML